MRAEDRVGIAVRRADGTVGVDAFNTEAGRLASSRIGRMWGIRALFALRASSETARRALRTMTKLLDEGADVPDDGKKVGQKALSRGGVIVAATIGAGLGLIVQFGLFRVAPLVLAKEAGLTGAWFLIVEAILRLVLLLGALRLVALMPQSRRLLAYHGAEHKAIAALEGDWPLRPDIVGRFSRFHPRCGTSFLVGSSLLSIPIYGIVLALTGAFSYPALILTRLVCAPFITALALEGQRLVARGDGWFSRLLRLPGLAAQRVTTQEPGEEELEVACAALNAALGRDTRPMSAHAA